MDEVISQLSVSMPDISFQAGRTFAWSPKLKRITYAPSSTQPAPAIWSLLHEASHALLGHFNYESDFELLKLEVAAWHKARQLATGYGHEINEGHIERCLDTYRDWLHLRSTCPVCKARSLQTDATHYTCFNCQTGWQVTASRFCRPYRLQKQPKYIKKSPAHKVQTTFR